MEKEVIEMTKSIQCESASVWMMDDEEQVIYPYIYFGPNAQALDGLTLTLDQGICGYCVKHKEEIISNDLAQDTRWYSFADTKTKYVTKNIICLPIVIYDECYGCVQLLNKKGGFTKHDVDVCRDIIAYIVDNL